jgi:hypothetical protein
VGILTLDGGIRSVDVHPNRAWIDGWNYDAALNTIRGIGDVDGDSRDELIVTSDWGIGVVKYDGHSFRGLMAAPRDTWFGGWRYDATINPGRDQIKEVRDFTGSGKSEVMVWSSWGIATLEYGAGTFAASRIHANGARLGGWLLNTLDNAYRGAGQFDADRKADMVVTSPWGLGILSLERGTHIYMAPNGTRFGGWLLNTADNRVRHVADFDGDGQDEILVTSPWGVGVLKMVGGALTSVAMHANGTNIDGHVVRNSNSFALADNLRGGARRQIVIADTAGLHALELGADRLTRVAFVPNGQRIGGWIIDTGSNRFTRAGDLNGDGRAEVYVRSPWGVGVLGIDPASQWRCYGLHAFGSVLADWYLQSSDVVVGPGKVSANRSELIVTKP